MVKTIQKSEEQASVCKILGVLLKSMNKYSMHKLDCLMKKWEYKNLSTTKVSKMDVSALNELGQDGWEMVAATLKRIYFKRPLN